MDLIFTTARLRIAVSTGIEKPERKGEMVVNLDGDFEPADDEPFDAELGTSQEIDIPEFGFGVRRGR